MSSYIDSLISGFKNVFGGGPPQQPPQILHAPAPANWAAPQQMPGFQQPQQPQQDMGAMLKQLLDFKREQIARQNGMSPERTKMYFGGGNLMGPAPGTETNPFSWGTHTPADYVHLQNDQPAVDMFRTQQPESPEQVGFQQMGQLLRPGPALATESPEERAQRLAMAQRGLGAYLGALRSY